jgi:hypothetical protein
MDLMDRMDLMDSEGEPLHLDRNIGATFVSSSPPLLFSSSPLS